MKEKTLLRIALMCMITGMMGLFFISENIEIDSLDLSRIDETKTGEYVKFIGRIEGVNQAEKVMFLEVGQEKIETVSVILFLDSGLPLEKGDYVEIEGEIDEYDGEKEIIANKVRII